MTNTAWKASKYGVSSGLLFPVFSPNTEKDGKEKTPYLDTFHAVKYFLSFSNFRLMWDIKRGRATYDRSSLPQVFLGKGILKIYSKFTGEQPCQSAISIKFLCNFIKITLWHGCSPVSLLHIFRTLFPKKIWRGASDMRN